MDGRRRNCWMYPACAYFNALRKIIRQIFNLNQRPLPNGKLKNIEVQTSRSILLNLWIKKKKIRPLSRTYLNKFRVLKTTIPLVTCKLNNWWRISTVLDLNKAYFRYVMYQTSKRNISGVIISYFIIFLFLGTSV